MNVFYVTAVHPAAQPLRIDHVGVPVMPRTGVAKFFVEAHAKDFARGLLGSWHDIRVEAKDESAEDQHPAHKKQ
jgi:hypothetical protein